MTDILRVWTYNVSPYSCRGQIASYYSRYGKRIRNKQTNQSIARSRRTLLQCTSPNIREYQRNKFRNFQHVVVSVGHICMCCTSLYVCKSCEKQSLKLILGSWWISRSSAQHCGWVRTGSTIMTSYFFNDFVDTSISLYPCVFLDLYTFVVQCVIGIFISKKACIFRFTIRWKCYVTNETTV